MKTTFKQVQNDAHSLGLKLDRPAERYINIRKRGPAGAGWIVLYTAQSTQEAYAWLQGYRSCVLEIVNNNTTAKEIWERVTAS